MQVIPGAFCSGQLQISLTNNLPSLHLQYISKTQGKYATLFKYLYAAWIM